MATEWNVKDTPLSGGKTVGQVQPATLNFSKDFAKKEAKTSEMILTNLTSPLDCVETIRFAHNSVANIYANTGIDPNVYASSRRGFSILSQISETLTVVSDDQKTRIDLPLSAHIVLKGPASEYVTGAILSSLVTRLVGTLFEEGDSTMDARLNSLVRGALTPKALV